MWPAFAVITLIDGVLLHKLPPIDLSTTANPGIGLIPAILMATFGNIILVGLIAPWLAKRTIAHREAPAGPPSHQARYEWLVDRIGTGLLVAGIAGIIAAGLAARPAIVSETDATQANAEAIRDMVIESDDAELKRNLETADTIRLSDGYFRTCIARDQRGRFRCFFVDTNRSPTRIVEDQSQESNSTFKVR